MQKYNILAQTPKTNILLRGKNIYAFYKGKLVLLKPCKLKLPMKSVMQTLSCKRDFSTLYSMFELRIEIIKK